MRLFLDANVLFSAAKSDGAVRRLVEALVVAGHECWVDGFVVEEARRNLAAKDSDREQHLAALVGRLHVASAASVINDVPAIRQIAEKDQPVVAAAIRMRCEALVTGDKTHFGRFYGRSIGPVTIHSPASIHELLFPR
ncbi:MAG: PIN domain-containing protein [Planctomycetaceae bacterium]